MLSIWAVSSSGSTVHAIRAAVPANIGAAASRALCSITLLWGSHLGKLGLLCNKWAVSSSGSTVHAIRAAVPANIGAAATWASWVFLATNGQSAAVAAQYMPSGQQYQPTLGQQPPGQGVPSHCLGAAILVSWVFLATNGQSAAVAAQ